MVIKELVMGVIGTITALVSKYLKEILIFGIGIYIGATFFPSVKVIEPPTKTVVEKVEVIKEVPVHISSGASIDFVKKENDNDVDVEVINNGTKVKGLYTKTDGTKIYFDFPTSEKESVSKENGKFVFRQETSTSIDVTEIVDKLNAEERERHKQELEHQKAIENRRVIQHAFWGVVGGVAFEKLKK